MFSKKNQLFKDISSDVARASGDYSLLSEGDRIMVGVSGGKDSAILLAVLCDIQKRAPFHFDVHGVMLDQGQPGFSAEKFLEWTGVNNLPLDLIYEDTYTIVKEKVPANKTTCGLCSRLRRGILYTHARLQGYNKLALGHHRDDINETLLMNMFYTGKLSAMPAKYLNDEKDIEVIRPLVYVAETTIARLAEDCEIPVIPCNLCGSQDGLKRQQIKSLLRELEKGNPRISNSILASLQNVRTSHLLDRRWV